MKILQVHNFYQQRGGEDTVFAAEHDLLRDRGDTVIQYSVHNDAIDQISKLAAASKTIWNSDTYRAIESLIRQHSPDVVHAHNTFPLVSPSLYYAASSAGVPVVQTLHNYRLLCPKAIFFRDGRICEDCLGKLPYPAIVHACYRESRTASAAVVALLTAHRSLRTWHRKIQTFIALTAFAKEKFVSGGISAQKIVVKPNFLAQDPGIGDGSGRYALFAGRLSEEKGLRILLQAWRRLPPTLVLKIAGDGDLYNWVAAEARELKNVEVIGRCERDRILELAKRAAFQVVPSEWYEGLPMTIVEAFACGTPVVTSRLASMDDLVTHGVNGARFENGSADDLADCISNLWASPLTLIEMRKQARASYERTYTPDLNYEMLIRIYREAGNQKRV